MAVTPILIRAAYVLIRSTLYISITNGAVMFPASIVVKENIMMVVRKNLEKERRIRVASTETAEFKALKLDIVTENLPARIMAPTSPNL